MKYKIRRAVQEDEDLIMSFRKKAYSSGHKSLNREYWQWKFLLHPWAQEIPFFVIVSDGKIVGTQGYWPVRLNFHEQLLEGAMLIDLRVLDNYKGLPAVKLYRAVQSMHIFNIGASLSEDARRFFRSAKWTDLSDQLGELYYFLKNTETEPSFISKIKFAARASEKKRTNRKIAKNRGSNLHLKISNKYPIEINSILQNCREGICTIHKDINWLRWRYEQCPISNYQYASLYEEDRLKATLVFRIHYMNSQKIFQIVDFFYRPNDIEFIVYLLADCIDYCKTINVSALETKLTGDLLKTLKGIEFRKSENSLGLMMHAKDKKLQSEISRQCILPFTIGNSDLW